MNAVRVEKQVSREEEMKRQTVLTKTRKSVLIKIYALQGIKVSQLGIPRVERDEKAIDAEHIAEAEKRGINPTAYRAKPDTGYNLIPKGQYRGVRIGNTLTRLESLGLYHVGTHWQDVPGKGPVIFMNFSSEGEIMPLSKKVHELLLLPFNDLTVWCNLKFNDNNDLTKGQHRLDTINLAFPYIHEGESWELVIPKDHPNTYRVV